MLSEWELPIEDESKISLIVFWVENRFPKIAKIKRERIEISVIWKSEKLQISYILRQDQNVWVRTK